ncbi:MAG: 5'/3'-nucleotidase SurE [Candidatus Poseidoniaceae archaeon]|nr:5'/3'-nucleotidase SurE [Candidatus Poseidoniaceae archaeon]
MSDEFEGGWILLTNDDGIEAPGFRLLVQALNTAGHQIVAFAPHANNSAAGMRINLGTPMELRERKDLVESWGLDEKVNAKLFELEGTPCDTMIVALDGGLEHAVPGIRPRLVVSGVNLGPNMSQDSYHSGTMGAAREAGLYGMPAIASSYTSFDEDGMEVAIQATVELVELALSVLPNEPMNLRRPSVDLSEPHVSRWPVIPQIPAWNENPKSALRTAFIQGEMMLNLNVPPGWNGKASTTRLGMRWYRDAITFNSTENDETATFTIGAASIDHTPVLQSDCDTVGQGKASVTCLPVWPQTHPLALDDQLLTWALEASEGGYPAWLYN